MRILLSAGAKANARGKYGTTPITAAAQRNNAEIVRLLIAGGADPNIKGPQTVSPLAWASTYGYSDVVKELLSARAAVFNKDDWWPALISAARNEHTETMDILLRAGADIDQRAYDGKTALMYAAWQCKPRSVRFLLKNGADVNLRDKYSNLTALSLAINSTLANHDSQRAEIIHLLRNAGAIE
jgi:ankyrin repeat protein